MLHAVIITRIFLKFCLLLASLTKKTARTCTELVGLLDVLDVLDQMLVSLVFTAD